MFSNIPSTAGLKTNSLSSCRNEWSIWSAGLSFALMYLYPGKAQLMNTSCALLTGAISKMMQKISHGSSNSYLFSFFFLLRTIPGESERQVTAITVSADKEAADTFHMQEIKKNIYIGWSGLWVALPPACRGVRKKKKKQKNTHSWHCSGK